MSEPGPLTRVVLDYTRTMERLVPSVKGPDDWAPLAEFVAVDRFERVGTSRELYGWRQYAEMLTRWAGSIAKFETAVRRVSELPDLVYFEVEERHFAGGEVHVVNSMSVFGFDAHHKIQRLDVYLQQRR